MKRIAAHLGVSPGTVHAWTADIKITAAQRRRNHKEAGRDRGLAWAERNRQRRAGYQEEGRAKARENDPLHQAGCMLYWAEGTKNRNTLTLANSDSDLVAFFCRFVRESLGMAPGDFRIRLNVYTDNGLTIREIEDHWLAALELPRSGIRGHSLNNLPTSSSGMKRNRLPYGVCTVRVCRSTRLVQHVYGAIQEYADFDEPRWLDCLPSGAEAVD